VILQPGDYLVQQHRLTTESGIPVSSSDRTSQGTIYLTPYTGDLIATYTGLGNQWEAVRSPEVSLALSSLTADKLYDVFAYRSGTGIALELSAAWTNDTTRADALALQNGRYVKSSNKTRLLVGTFRTTATTTTEDSLAKRFLHNAYNQVSRAMLVKETTDSWTYTTATYRSANGSDANRLQWVTGDSSSLIRVSIMTSAYNLSNTVRANIGIGIDSTSADSGSLHGGTPYTQLANVGVYELQGAVYSGYPGLGFHFAQWLERSDATGTTVWFGDDGGAAMPAAQGGIEGRMFN
jgi:hypothetical protein